MQRMNNPTPIMFVAGVWACRLLSGLEIPPNVPSYIEIVYRGEGINYIVEDINKTLPDKYVLVKDSLPGYYNITRISTGNIECILRPILFPNIGSVEIRRGIYTLQVGQLLTDVKFQTGLLNTPEQHRIQDVMVGCIEHGMKNHYKLLQDRYDSNIMRQYGYVPKSQIIDIKR